MSEWWQHGVIYQIYPRSFQDSDGDGIGDLPGIERRLDHLTDLGVDALWISPVYPSPMEDFGYDVSDYCGIDPIFGTLPDFDRLLAAAHGRGLRVLLDFVPSHTSDQHPWFVEARAARDSPKRDWYVWADPRDGGLPSNWISEFGGPAWTWDAGTQQYYLHIFLPSQPALNWRNPQVQAAMADILRFWFDRGVDGVRVDAVENMAPDDLLRDNPPNPDWTPRMGPARSLLTHRTQHQPVIHDFARQMRAVAAEYAPERLLIGEVYGDYETLVPYYGRALDGFHLPFNFALIDADWDAGTIAGLAEAYEAALPDGAWPNWVLGNHDRSRIASRAGPERARLVKMLLLSLRGTPTLYQGDELGMEDAAIAPGDVRDPWELNVPGRGLGRDPVRTPIPWEAGPGAGFTTGTPWLPITVPAGGPAAVQRRDPASMLALTRALLALRRAEPALGLGDYRTLSVRDGVLVFARLHARGDLRVALNFADAERPLDLPGTMLVSTRMDGGAAGTLRAHEGVIVRPPG